MARDPDFAIQFLGEPPELTELDGFVWDVFWSIRNATPADYPIDPLRALEWYERLYGCTDAHVFGRQVRSMDAEFLKTHHERTKKRMEEAGSGGRGKK